MANSNDEQASFTPINTRAAEMWEMMQVIDWCDKEVLDIGCGAGDMLLYAAEAGAATVIGIDKNEDVIADARSRMIFHPKIVFIHEDIEKHLVEAMPHFDVIICLSVLPYLARSAYDVLSWIALHSTYAFIECQYYGDGPGKSYIKNDADMENIFRGSAFKKFTKLGFTVVEDRETERSLWLCE